MRPGRWPVADAVVVVGFVAVVVLAIGAIGSWPAGPTPWRVEISIRYSRFEPARLSVPAGRPVTFVLRNEDPIDHEWLIGDEQMHQRHRTGTEPFHDSRPTEVSIPPLTTIETTVVFDGQVTWRYVCHLPGHEAYGMVGVLTSH